MISVRTSFWRCTAEPPIRFLVLGIAAFCSRASLFPSSRVVDCNSLTFTVAVSPLISTFTRLPLIANTVPNERKDVTYTACPTLIASAVKDLRSSSTGDSGICTLEIPLRAALIAD